MQRDSTGNLGPWAVVCFCLTMTLIYTVCHAQPAVVPIPPTKAEPSRETPSDVVAITDLGKKRATIELELEALANPDPVVPQGGLLERRALLEQIARGYDEQLEDYKRVKEATHRLADIVRSSAEWIGFAEVPPYSIFFVDQLWGTTFSLRLAVEGLQSQVSFIALRFDRARESLETAEKHLRQASEELESVTDPSQATAQRAQRDLAELRLRAAGVRVAAAEISKKRVEAEISETQAALSLATRQLESAEQQRDFGEKDLEKVRKRLSQERQALEEALERTLTQQRAGSQSLQASVQRASQLAPVSSKKKAPQTVTRAKMDVELKRTELDNLIVQGDLLRQLLDVVEGERQLWESRFVVAHDGGASRAREAYARLAPLFAHFRAFRDHMHQQLVATSGRISELANRLKNASSADDRRQVTTMLQVYRQRESVYNDSLRRSDDASRFFERWKSEFKEQKQGLPLSATIDDGLRQIWEVVKGGWAFEVFSAEDTIELEGKKITGYRSVTLGKIVSALGILLVGYWLCLILAKQIGRLAITRLGMSAGVANLMRQWSQAFLIMVLIVISLVSVKIPLTIFAFLGGAFAIGVGFGAQNLLKNLISGILILIERPLRVGDLIEVDNVRGRVTTIGLRSSTVRDTKGIDTLIPNSSFLERSLTNWTHSSQQGRFALRVGAPYGSSTQGVIELLTNVTGAHPQVLKAPQPQILLEEFGAQARIFTLNYWLEIRLDIDPNKVASDLRFSIEEQFVKAGLKVLPAA